MKPVSCLLAAALLLFAATSSLARPMLPGAGWIDVTQPPYNADPTGQRDATAAIQRAMDDSWTALLEHQERERRISYLAQVGQAGSDEFKQLVAQPTATHWTIYLPNGTYRVSDTLTFGNDERTPGNPRVQRRQFVGESRDGVILRLADNARGFNDPDNPRAVLEYLDRPFPSGSNNMMGNVAEDLTIDVGRGNPGAIAIDYNNNNWGHIINVRLLSSDPQGAGAVGLRLARGLGGIGWMQDITVEGFDYGIQTDSQKIVYPFENITLRNQNKAGFHNQIKGIAIRHLDSDQSRTGVPAIVHEGQAGQVALLDSTLAGGARDRAALESEDGSLFVRNVQTSGYGAAVRTKDGTVPAGQVSEFVYPKFWTLFDGTPTRSLGLEVQDLPLPEMGDRSNWTIVPNKPGEDMTSAIQHAIDAGTPVIVLERDLYRIDGTIVIRGGVQVFEGNWAALTRMIDGDTPMFRIEDGAGPVLIQRMEADGLQKSPIGFLNASGRPVVLRTIWVKSFGTAYRNTGTGDVHVNEMFAIHNDDPIVFRNQRAFLRHMNSEGPSAIVADGADVWVFGYKGEASAPFFEAINGARMEIFAGYLNGLSPAGESEAYRHSLLVDNSAMSIVGLENIISRGPGPHSPVIAREVRGNEIRELPHDALIKRDEPGRDGTGHHVLYVGDSRATLPADAPSVAIRTVEPIAREGGEPAMLEVSRSAASAQPMTIALYVDNKTTARPRSLKQWPRQVTIPAGQTSTPLPIEATENNDADGVKSLTVSVTGGRDYRVDWERSAAHATLFDNEVALKDDLEVRYTFDRLPIQDQTGNGYHPHEAVGVTVGKVDGRQALLFPAGQPDAHVRLNVSTSYREIIDGQLPAEVKRLKMFMHDGFGAQSVTVAVHAGPDVEGAIFKRAGWRGMGLRLEDGKLIGHVNGGPGESIEVAADWPGRGWHHVAFVFQRGLTMLFLDGELAAMEEAPFASVPKHRGDTSDLGPLPGGAIADFRNYTRALNPAEVAELAAEADRP